MRKTTVGSQGSLKLKRRNRRKEATINKRAEFCDNSSLTTEKGKDRDEQPNK